MAKKRVSKSRKKSYLKRVSRRTMRRISRRKEKRKIKKTRKKNKRGGAHLPKGSGIVETLEEESSMRHQRPELQPEPELQPQTETPLEDPKQIEEYVLSVLISQYNPLTTDERRDIFKASLLYSHQFDGFHNVLIRNYHNSDEVDIKLFDESLVQKSNELSPSIVDATNYLYGDKLLDECQAANEILIEELNTAKVITPKFCVEKCSFLHSVMKNNCLTLDRSITVYRGILIGTSTQYLNGFNTKLNGFSSTSYFKKYSMGYILNIMLGKSIFGKDTILIDVFVKIILEQLDNENDFNFSETFRDIRILKITLPSGTRVFNTDICGKGETELTLLDEGELKIISEKHITPNNDDEFDKYFEEILSTVYAHVGMATKWTMGGRTWDEEKEFDNKLDSKKIDRDKFKLKQVECNFVPHEEQKNYSEVLFDPLIAELNKS